MPERVMLHHRGTAVLIDQDARFGQDALLLAEFAQVWRRHRVLDLGTGCGILPLALYDAGYEGRCTAIELDEKAADLAARAAEENGLDTRLTVLCGDLRGYTAESKFDAALCNPPYFAAGTGKSSARSYALGARHETACTLDDVAAAAARNLKEGGKLAICLRPERLAELLHTLRTRQLEPKRLQFVKHEPQGAPWLVLIDARYRAGVGLTILPDRITPKKQLSRAELERNEE